jgi:hypothetical protein
MTSEDVEFPEDPQFCSNPFNNASLAERMRENDELVKAKLFAHDLPFISGHPDNPDWMMYTYRNGRKEIYDASDYANIVFLFVLEEGTE